MPHRKSAYKALRQSKKKHKRNKAIKSRLRTERNRFDRMLGRGDVEEASDQLDQLTKILQRAADKNIIHKNKAARLQSQAQKRLNQLKES
jgi:small subunit ribosomal protein S20